jgi:hypothetical protein
MPDRDLEQIKIWIDLGLPERKDIAKLDAKLIASVVKPASTTGSVAMAAKPMENDSGNKIGLKEKSGSAGTMNSVSPDGQIKAISSNTSRVAVTSLAWSDKLGGVLRPITGGVALLEEKGNVVRSFPFPEKQITKVRLSPDGKFLLIAGGEGAQTGRVAGERRVSVRCAGEGKKQQGKQGKARGITPQGVHCTHPYPCQTLLMACVFERFGAPPLPKNRKLNFWERKKSPLFRGSTICEV